MNTVDMEEPNQDIENRPISSTSTDCNPGNVLKMAEEVASNMGCSITPILRNAISSPCNYFHQDQQSASMLIDFQRRKVHSYDTMRNEVIRMKRIRNQPLPYMMDMTNVNPTSITLSLEVEADYYPLMQREIENAQNMASIMSKTNTLIQMPNRYHSQIISPFVQQVTITGLYHDVERARIMIRQNCPIVVRLDLTHAKIGLKHFEDLCQNGSIKYPFVDLEVHHSKNRDDPPYLRLMCREKDQEFMRKAVEELSGTIFNHSLPNNGFTITFNVSTYHVEHVIGKPMRNVYLMPLIEKKTKAKITYPKYNRGTDYGENIFPITIKGELDQVLRARSCISELLPVAVCVNLKDTDMREPVVGKRNLDVYNSEDRVSIRITVSFHEPSELLAGEVIHHCVTLRTKEFNVKALYMSYKRLLNENIEVIAPEPSDFDNSMWFREPRLDQHIMTFKLPCRGETPDPHHMFSSVPMAANTISNRCEENHTRAANDNTCQKSDDVVHSATTPQEISAPTAPHLQAGQINPAMHYYYNRILGQGHLAVKGFNEGCVSGGMPLVIPPQYYYFDNNGQVIVSSDYVAQRILPDNSRLFPMNSLYNNCYAANMQLLSGFPSLSVSEGDSQNPSQSRRINEQYTQGVQHLAHTQNVPVQRNSSSSTRIAYPSNSSRHQRGMDCVRTEDDAKSIQSNSRRTSLSLDEVVVNGYESAHQNDRVAMQRGLKNGQWKGSYHSKSTFCNNPNQNYRESYHSKKNEDNMEFGNRNYRGDESPAASSPSGHLNQFNFTTSQHLMLKTSPDNDRSLDRENLYTQDNSQVEEKHIPIKGHQYTNRTCYSPSMEYENRAHNGNLNQREEQCRHAENEKSYGVPELLEMKERYKKTAAVTSVAKVILEPKARNDKNFSKINLEHRDKLKTDEGYSRIKDVEKFIVDVARESGNVAKMDIGNRTYADILKEKNEEMKKVLKVDNGEIIRDETDNENLPIVEKQPNIAASVATTLDIPNQLGYSITGV